MDVLSLLYLDELILKEWFGIATIGLFASYVRGEV